MDSEDLQSLESLANLLRATRRRMAAKAGLQMVHYDILDYLSRCEPECDTLAHIVAALGQTKGTVSQSIKLLCARGYLDRSGDSADRRRQHLHLTAKAIDALKFVQLEISALTGGVEITGSYGRVFSAILSDILRQVQDTAVRRRRLALEQAAPAPAADDLQDYIADIPATAL